MPDTFWMFLTEGPLCRKIKLGGCHVALQLKYNCLLNRCSVWKRDNMGPLVVDTLEELRNIQQSLWDVSPAGSFAPFKQGTLLSMSGLCILVLFFFCQRGLRHFYIQIL